MRIGLAGAGRIGARHAETLGSLPEVESVVIADVDEGRARALAEEYGARGGRARWTSCSPRAWTGSSWPPRPTPTRSW